MIQLQLKKKKNFQIYLILCKGELNSNKTKLKLYLKPSIKE